jgi:hypothetical protein
MMAAASASETSVISTRLNSAHTHREDNLLVTLRREDLKAYKEFLDQLSNFQLFKKDFFFVLT